MTTKSEKTNSWIWPTLILAGKNFLRIDGPQRAAAFAFYAFFALFPLIILLVTFGSALIDKGEAEHKVISYVEGYIPLSESMQTHIFDTVSGVMDARGEAGLVATLMLIWATLKFFRTLIFTTNRAWGTHVGSWWQLPLQSLLLLAIMVGTVLVGIAVPILTRMIQSWLFSSLEFHLGFRLFNFLIPLLVVFLSLSLFYKFAPKRVTRFSDVWAAALIATVLMRVGETLFVVYLERFAKFNAVYGAFGGIMALLLWIYVSGCIFIFGACLCSAQHKTLANLEPGVKPSEG